MHRPNNKDESWLSVHIMSFGFDSFHLGVDKPIIYRVDHTAKYMHGESNTPISPKHILNGPFL